MTNNVWGSDAFYNAARKLLHKMTDDKIAREAFHEVVASGMGAISPRDSSPSACGATCRWT